MREFPVRRGNTASLCRYSHARIARYQRRSSCSINRQRASHEYPRRRSRREAHSMRPVSIGRFFRHSQEEVV